jgi:predicted regulator of Ras-like GTPase activity (Roadblock/LC7/MglB family)
LQDFSLEPDSIDQEPLLKQDKPTKQEPKTMAIDFGKLNTVLQNFVSATPDIQGAAIVTPDGLPLASALPGSLNEERVAAMSAAMLSLGERIASELSRGSTDRIFLEGEMGYAILTSCGDDAVFLVMASKAAKQGVLMLEIKQVVAQIKSALDRQLSAVA